MISDTHIAHTELLLVNRKHQLEKDCLSTASVVGRRKVGLSRGGVRKRTVINRCLQQKAPLNRYGMSMLLLLQTSTLLLLLGSWLLLFLTQLSQVATTTLHALPQPAASLIRGAPGPTLLKTGSTARRLPPASAPQVEHHFHQHHQHNQQDAQFAFGSTKIAVSSRLSPVRVPADSNAILKCLISGPQINEAIVVVWWRYSSATNELEELLPSDLSGETLNLTSSGNNNIIITSSDRDSGERAARKRQLPPLVDSPGTGGISVGSLDPLEEMSERQRQIRDFLSRSRQETRRVSNLILEASLAINPVKAVDNGTYFCTANDAATELGRARIDLVPLSKPRVDLVRIQFARDSRSALVMWVVASDGNTPIKKTILMVRNDTYSASDLNGTGGQVIVTSNNGGTNQHHWRRIDIPDEGQPLEMSSLPSAAPVNQQHPSQVSTNYQKRAPNVADSDVDITSPLNSTYTTSPPAASPKSLKWPQPTTGRPSNNRMRAHNLTGLQPGVTYSFRLAALNDMGQSGWSELVATAPNDLPVQITEIQLLGASNDTLAIGWRRPQYDTAKTVRYEMQLFDLNRTLTLDAYTNTSSTGPIRNNFMYVFVNLQPGTDYHFQVRACSKAGCSSWSWPRLLASTVDGEPDEPTEVELSCDLSTGELSATWLQPLHPRGQLMNYTLTLESKAEFWNQSGQLQTEEWRQSFDTPDNQTLAIMIMSATATGALYQQLMSPNTNYSIRVCANNRSSRCGRFSSLTSRSQCSTPPELPHEMPAGLKLVPEIESGGISLELPPIERRNGSIDCLELALIRLPGTYYPRAPLADFLPPKPQQLMDYMTSQQQPTNQNPQIVFVYLAERVMLDPRQDKPMKFQLGDGSSIIHNANNDNNQSGGCGKLAATNTPIQDLKLNPNTYYSGFVRFLMAAPPQVSYSDYLEPVITGQTVPEPTGPTISLIKQPGGGNDVGDAAIMGQQLKELASRVGSTLSAKAMALYQQASSFITENVSLDTLTDMLQKSSPGMQVLEVGIAVIGVSLFILLVVYLIRIPIASSKRRKRQKQQKLKDEMSKEIMNKMEPPIEKPPGILAAATSEQTNVIQDYVALPATTTEAYPLPKPECPIHSSPSHHMSPPPLDAPHEDSIAQQQQQQYKQHHQEQLYPIDYGNSASTTLQHGAEVMEQYRNCRTMRRQSEKYQLVDKSYEHHQQQQQHHQSAPQHMDYSMTMSQSNSILAYAKKINKSIPLHMFSAVYECRLKNGWLRDEYELLPRPQLEPSGKPPQPQQRIKLRAQLVVSRDDSISALISGNEYLDASLVRLPTPMQTQTQSSGHGPTHERQLICARSPLDADSVWDLWRLVYEQEVGIIVMLGQVEDPHTGETRCAQYWPTSDNEETTILSPCNEYVQRSMVQPAKFKIRQETLENDGAEEYKIRRLTLMVMATRPEENAVESSQEQASLNKATGEQQETEDEESLVIIERSVIQLQYIHWNSSTPEARTRLIKFVEMAGEQHQRITRDPQTHDSPSTNDEIQSGGYQSPMLVHCYNGLSRTGLFTAMSSVVDELALKLNQSNRSNLHEQLQAQPKINLFHLVSDLRSQRDLLLSPYRLYELLYQLTATCIPPTSHPHNSHQEHHQTMGHHPHHHHHHHHNHGHNHSHHHQQDQQQYLVQQLGQIQNTRTLQDRQYQQQLQHAHLHNQHHHNHHLHNHHNQYQVQH